MSDLKDELRQERREKEWAETWKPSGPGDKLIGTLEGYDEATTDFGTYTVAHIRDEDGVLKGLWLMHSVLQDEWEEAAPEKGDRVGAMYHGQRSGDNYDYHMWSVKVDHSARDEGGESDTAGTDTAAGNDRAPQAPGSDSYQSEAGGELDGEELYGPPATETETEKDTAGESTMDDPNGGLPF